MPPAAQDPSGPASLVLAGLVLIAAGFLGWRQSRDARDRPADLSPADARHFRRQDLRRIVGTIVLAAIAIGLGIGGRLPTRVAGRANLLFVQVWSAITFLIVALLALALIDWFSIRAYARRHRQRLTREGLAIVEAELRVRMEEMRQAEGRVGPDAHHGPNGKPRPSL